VRINQSSDPRAPGMLKSHYSPLKPLLLCDIRSSLDQYRKQSPILILFDQLIEDYPIEKQILLSPNRSITEAATNLFSVLRQADKLAGEIILAERVPANGLGIAINDRLKRASVQS
jgi:L-threonylcarbamoyladenylate synthase